MSDISETPEPGTGSLRDRCEEEVLGLHRFFERWYRGEPDPSGEEFARVSDVLTEDFRMVNPDGALVTRSELLAGLRSVHGTKPGGPQGFRIRIERLAYRMLGRGMAAVTYEEWHEAGTRSKGRISTAIFREHDDTPNGVEWVHVHETWLPTDDG